MKWRKQVVLFAAKNIFKGEMTNKSAFYFLWYSEIRVENLKKKKSVQITEAISANYKFAWCHFGSDWNPYGTVSVTSQAFQK